MNWFKFHWKSLFNKEDVLKDKEDKRDYTLTTGVSNYPPYYRQTTHTSLNQGRNNNCTNYAVSSIMEDLRHFNKGFLSRFYIWTKARIKENRFPKNEGVYSRTVMNILNKRGIMFKTNKTENIKYTPSALDDLTARSIRGGAIQYYRGRNIADIRYGLINGFGVYVALRVTKEIQRYTGGVINEIKNPNYGFGHALHCIGYDDRNDYLIIKNSWGHNWGERGNFRISYHGFDSIVYDIWLIKPLSFSKSI